MIRVYLDDFYGTSGDGWKHKTTKQLIKRRIVLMRWLRQMDKSNWEFGLTYIREHIERCVYFVRDEDAVAFRLTFGAEVIVREGE